MLFLRLTIVRKIDAGDGSYPSVNTCVHYLKVIILIFSAVVRNVTPYILFEIFGHIFHEFLFPAARLLKRECAEREAVGCNCRERIPPQLRECAIAKKTMD